MFINKIYLRGKYNCMYNAVYVCIYIYRKILSVDATGPDSSSTQIKVIVCIQPTWAQTLTQHMTQSTAKCVSWTNWVWPQNKTKSYKVGMWGIWSRIVCLVCSQARFWMIPSIPYTSLSPMSAPWVQRQEWILSTFGCGPTKKSREKGDNKGSLETVYSSWIPNTNMIPLRHSEVSLSTIWCDLSNLSAKKETHKITHTEIF